jgi:DNA-binding MarR family transcriptional regulator
MTEFTIDATNRLRRSVGDLGRAIQKIEGTPGGHLETLGLLSREGAQSIAQLARSRRIRHQSMSSTVAELEKQGLVKRSLDPADKRGVLIQLTDAGSAVVDESRLTRSTLLFDAATKALNEEERERLVSTAELLERVRAELESDAGSGRTGGR